MILPNLFLISLSLVMPLMVFSLLPLNTDERARVPRAILLTLFFFIAFIPFIAFIFIAFIFIAFMAFMVLLFMAFFMAKAMAHELKCWIGRTGAIKSLSQ